MPCMNEHCEKISKRHQLRHMPLYTGAVCEARRTYAARNHKKRPTSLMNRESWRLTCEVEGCGKHLRPLYRDCVEVEDKVLQLCRICAVRIRKREKRGMDGSRVSSINRQTQRVWPDVCEVRGCTPLSPWGRGQISLANETLLACGSCYKRSWKMDATGKQRLFSTGKESSPEGSCGEESEMGKPD